MPTTSPAPVRGIDRRSFIKATAGAAALVAVGTTLSSCDVIADHDDPDRLLVERATFGMSTDTMFRIWALGRTSWLDEQLAPAGLDTSAVDAKVASLPAVASSAQQLDALYRGSGAAQAGFQLVLATAIRQVESPAQLFERMVEFWSDHLNVPLLDEKLRILKVVEDREVIRPHALGRFRDLLLASAQSPAMLVFLDGARSEKTAPNENYARELLELHTVGVDGGYTEDDVASLARLLTGWTVDPRNGLFAFDPDRHDSGPLTIMGWARPDGGDPFDHGRQFLAWLSSHPSTARFIATKLARRFQADEPDPGLVDDLAATYLANDTAIAPVLRTLFDHPAFAASVGGKFRRPHDWFVAACRASGAAITPSTTERDLGVLGRISLGLGQAPFHWPAPNGYPDTEEAWLTAGGLLARWNAAGDLVRGAIPLTGVDHAALRRGLSGVDVDVALDVLAQRVLFRELTTEGRHLLRAHAGLQPGTVVNDGLALLLVYRIVPLMLALGDFQYR